MAIVLCDDAIVVSAVRAEGVDIPANFLCPPHKFDETGEKILQRGMNRLLSKMGALSQIGISASALLAATSVNAEDAAKANTSAELIELTLGECAAQAIQEGRKPEE